MNKYKTGQTLISKENPNNKRKVLGVCDLVVFVSYINGFESTTGNWYYTEQELDRYFTIEKVDWKPELLVGYFFVKDNGYLGSDIWENDRTDQFRLKQKNVFETREEAEERLSELNK